MRNGLHFCLIFRIFAEINKPMTRKDIFLMSLFFWIVILSDLMVVFFPNKTYHEVKGIEFPLTADSVQEKIEWAVRYDSYGFSEHDIDSIDSAVREEMRIRIDELISTYKDDEVKHMRTIYTRRKDLEITIRENTNNHEK